MACKEDKGGGGWKVGEGDESKRRTALEARTRAVNDVSRRPKRTTEENDGGGIGEERSSVVAWSMRGKKKESKRTRTREESCVLLLGLGR